MLPIMLAAMAAVTSAMPSYIAVPSDQIAFVDLRQLRVRVPRQTLQPPPPQQLPQALYQEDYLPIQPLQLSQLQNEQIQNVQVPLQNQHYRILEEEPLGPRQQERIQYQPIPILPQRFTPLQVELAPQQQEQQQQQQQQKAPLKEPDAETEASHAETRPPDFGEYVDFGAHTGDNGAFGWYADYPINNHGDSYRK